MFFGKAKNRSEAEPVGERPAAQAGGHVPQKKHPSAEVEGCFMEVRGIEPPSEWATYERLQVYPGTLVLGDA